MFHNALSQAHVRACVNEDGEIEAVDSCEIKLVLFSPAVSHTARGSCGASRQNTGDVHMFSSDLSEPRGSPVSSDVDASSHKQICTEKS